jgi:hypothetical protein
VIEKPKKKSDVATFRLKAEAHDLLYARAEQAGVSTRVWLEEAIIGNKTRIIARQKPHPELRPLLFQVNKAGVDINQLVRHFNTMKLEHTITKDEYLIALDTLRSIEKLFIEALDYAR